MENTVNLFLDLSTEQGKQIFAAVNAVLGNTVSVAKEVKAPEAKVVKTPNAAPVVTGPTPTLPTPTPPAPSAITFPTVAAPAVPAASLPTPPAPTPPAAPKAPTPPAAPTAPSAPKAPKVTAPVVPFESLDVEGKREAIKKVVTKWSKKGKTTDIKTLFAAYGAANVDGIGADYLDHFNWAINTFDTNGQDMAAVLATFGA